MSEQLTNYHPFLHTHRSYLVNIQHIQNVEDNGQGFLLQTRLIPVSRSLLAALEQC